MGTRAERGSDSGSGRGSVRFRLGPRAVGRFEFRLGPRAVGRFQSGSGRLWFRFGVGPVPALLPAGVPTPGQAGRASISGSASASGSATANPGTQRSSSARMGTSELSWHITPIAPSHTRWISR